MIYRAIDMINNLAFLFCCFWFRWNSLCKYFRVCTSSETPSIDCIDFSVFVWLMRKIKIILRYERTKQKPKLLHSYAPSRCRSKTVWETKKTWFLIFFVCAATITCTLYMRFGFLSHRNDRKIDALTLHSPIIINAFCFYFVVAVWR